LVPHGENCLVFLQEAKEKGLRGQGKEVNGPASMLYDGLFTRGETEEEKRRAGRAKKKGITTVHQKYVGTAALGEEGLRRG